MKARLKELAGEPGGDDACAVLQRWLACSEQAAVLKKRIKALDAELDAKAYAKYPQLSTAEAQALVVDYKWMAALQARLAKVRELKQALMQVLLTGRIRLLPPATCPG